jgi:hypothetical protein
MGAGLIKRKKRQNPLRTMRRASQTLRTVYNHPS